MAVHGSIHTRPTTPAGAGRARPSPVEPSTSSSATLRRRLCWRNSHRAVISGTNGRGWRSSRSSPTLRRSRCSVGVSSEPLFRRKSPSRPTISTDSPPPSGGWVISIQFCVRVPTQNWIETRQGIRRHREQAFFVASMPPARIATASSSATRHGSWMIGRQT